MPRPAVVEGLAGDVAQARCVVRDGAGEGVLLVRGVVAQHRRGEHEQLVGERADGGEHPGTAQHDAVVVLAGDVRHQRARGLLAPRDRAVGLRRDQRVRAEQVLLADLLVVAADVLAEPGVGPGEPLLRRGQRHQGAVQVVAGAAEHAERAVGPEFGRLTALDQILWRARGEEGGRDRIARRGRGIGQDLPVRRVVLHVVELGVAAHHIAESGVVRHAAGEGLALDLHVDASGGQPPEELAAAARRHTRTVPSGHGRSSRPARLAGRAGHPPARAHELADRHRHRRRRVRRRPRRGRLGPAGRVLHRGAAGRVHLLGDPARPVGGQERGRPAPPADRAGVHHRVGGGRADPAGRAGRARPC